GIGKAIALKLATEGFDVAVNDVAASDELEGVVASIRTMGRKARAVAGDISDTSSHAHILDEAALLGPLTTLVNNAGVGVMSRGDMLEVTEESYDRCQNINTRGTFFLCQAFAKRMLAAPSAQHRSIITISSSNVTALSISRSEYCISKAAVSMATKLFAARLSDHGIGVYEIQPGFIETDMTAPVLEKYQGLIDGGLTVIKRMGQPEDVARVAATMALGFLPYTVGQAVQVDGGLLSVRY
ncbi:MAG: 3-ketoacyl-ACP reductase, partial [Alphaproteobacteria bacterium]|nr:3-ketoacyl-ACP reductase [Alphaproteobacteria bacterium]